MLIATTNPWRILVLDEAEGAGKEGGHQNKGDIGSPLYGWPIIKCVVIGQFCRLLRGLTLASKPLHVAGSSTCVL